MVGHRTRESESPGRVYPPHGGATLRPEYFNRFSATSSEKVFFGPSAIRSLGDFFTDQTRYEKRSSTAKGLLLGICFVISKAVPKLSSIKLRHSGMSQDEGLNRLKDEMTD
jgi:hypothetical protein